MATAIAIGVLTSSVQRQLRYSVSAPPAIRPMAPPAPEIAPYTPNAFARSLGSVKVVVIRESTAGASTAAKTPCRARAPNSQRRVLRRAAEGGCGGEAEQPDEEGALAADEVSDSAAEQEQAAERERVSGECPLPRGVADVQRGLGVGEGDVHDRRIKDDHQLGDADDGEREPATVTR